MRNSVDIRIKWGDCKEKRLRIFAVILFGLLLIFGVQHVRAEEEMPPFLGGEGAFTGYFYKGSKTRVLSLYNQDGTLYTRISVKNGESVKLPSMKNPSGYTFLGWAESAGKRVNPSYEAGQTIKMTGNRKLYAVLFDRKKEKDLQASQLVKPNESKYSKVIFVGDSRTKGLQRALRNQLGSLPENVSVIAQGGKGLRWLQNYAAARLLSEVRRSSDETRPVAVVFNLGVNDLSYAQSYVRYMNKLAKKLKQRGCVLYYMSVNPMNNAMRGSNSKNEAKIRKFNKILKSGLSGNFTYINTYRWLMKNGFSTLNESGIQGGYDDGLHYTDATYKRIYNYCMKIVNKS